MSLTRLTQQIPGGGGNIAYQMGRILDAAFRRQAAEVARLLSHRTLNERGNDSLKQQLDHWPEYLAAVVKPLMVQLYQQGITESRRRLAVLQGGRVGAALYRKPQRISFHPDQTFGERIEKAVRLREYRKQLGISFDLFDPLVLRAVDKATLQFCEETNATAIGDLTTAIRKLRKLLKEGLEQGKAIAQLAREVKRIFTDPSRAFRIATTETSRAIHGGALLNAKESNLSLRKEWLASSDACELCLELNGVQKDLDEPFIVDGTGPYANIMHPPRHPHCFCVMQEVLA